MADRKTAFWIVVTTLVCLFAVFVMLAAFIQPEAHTENLPADEQAIVGEMHQMVWWMTVGLVMLPIMLLLITVAVYLFITSSKQNGNGTTKAETAPLAPASTGKHTIFGKTSTKVAEASSPLDVLDLRYARGEINREQYTAMKSDIKAHRL